VILVISGSCPNLTVSLPVLIILAGLPATIEFEGTFTPGEVCLYYIYNLLLK
jgi:hypothetical protein